MLLRDRHPLVNMLAAIMACVAVLVYAFSSPGTHAPNLHGPVTSLAIDGHSHDHGDHLHDDLDVAFDDTGASDHHHADHTHEKAGLAQAAGHVVRNSLHADFVTMASSLVGGPPYGIDRPPRTVTSL